MTSFFLQLVVKHKWRIAFSLLILGLVVVNLYLYWRNQSALPPRVVMHMEKSYGSAWPHQFPAYALTIYENGVVVYNGYTHVHTVGVVTSTITADRLQQLLTEAEDIGFATLSDPPKNFVDDLPNKTITIQGHTVRIYTYNTPALAALEAHIDAAVNATQWTTAP